MKRILSEAQRTTLHCSDYYGKVFNDLPAADEEFWREDLALQDKLAVRLTAKKRLSKIEVRTAFGAYYRGFQKAVNQAREREQARVAAEKSRQGAS